MKSNYNSELEVNLYFIKSDFKDILIRLCKKALEEKDRYLINLKDEKDLAELDKYLWIKDKNNFIPHQTFDDNLSEIDKLVLFYGPYEKLKKLEDFKKIIVSPNVKISKFKAFEKFMIFSNKVLSGDFLKELKSKFLKNKIKYKIFYEYDSLKWKLVN